jgi:FKBP-type peptidyl-prolyl cis-trans isomerase FkpA
LVLSFYTGAIFVQKKEMRTLFWGSLLIICGLGACSKKKCDFKDDGAVASANEQQTIKHYLDSLGITAQLHPRGFYYKIDNLGQGETPNECSQITLSYTGQLTNGTVFDQQTSFVTQLANLIDGWQQGVPLIQKGGNIWLYIPPSLGYGGQAITTSSGTIPAYSILIFDIHLLDVQ